MGVATIKSTPIFQNGKPFKAMICEDIKGVVSAIS